ncbi:MAG: hypothetical protein JNL11_07140 [Bdellovibrionaceae bacterium]|nr:hypothetical protein [Pseudobdellovibrionaceae bacterium]
MNVLVAAILALAINYIFSLRIEPVACVIFVVNLFAIELMLRLRWRMALICHECGFDPVIYRRNPALACQMVKQKMELRNADTVKSLFFPLNLPKRKELKKT